MTGQAYPLYQVLEPRSFADLLENAGRLHGSRIAFRSLREVHTYSQLVSDTRHAARYFETQREHFCWLNVSDAYLFAVSFFACISVGCVAVLCEQDDLRWLDLGSELVCLDDAKVKSAVKDSIDFAPSLDSYATSANALALVATSSGTTGHVKGVMLSQKNVLASTIGGMRNYRFDVGATYLHVIPYTHLFGIAADLIAPLHSGGTVCYSGNRLRFFEDLHFFTPTNLNAPPALVDAMHRLLKTTGSFEMATGGSLRKIICASAHMDDSVNDLFSEYGLRSYQGYGLTECSPCVALNRDDFYKAGSVGQLLPCLEARIEEGELCVRGPNVMMGYLHNPQVTAEVLCDGWLHTGDLGYVDKDHFVFLTGRKSNIVVFEDGTKHPLEELEHRIDALDSVLESRVDIVVQAGRTLLSLVVVLGDNQKEQLVQDDVLELLSILNLRAKVLDIHITKEPLPRNRMGKLLRNRAEQ